MFLWHNKMLLKDAACYETPTSCMFLSAELSSSLPNAPGNRYEIIPTADIRYA